jgi:hypothetical protein
MFQESGDYIESFMSMGLQPEGGKPLTPEEEDILKYCSSALYIGGSDTVGQITYYLVYANILSHSFLDSVCDEVLLPLDVSSP